MKCLSKKRKREIENKSPPKKGRKKLEEKVKVESQEEEEG